MAVPAPIRPTCAKSVTTDVKKRKSECAKVKLPSKDGVLGMLLAAANNGAVIPLALQQVEGKGDLHGQKSCCLILDDPG